MMKHSKKGLALVFLILIIAVIAVVILKSSASNEKAWPKDTLADQIPQYSAKVHDYDDFDDCFNIDIYGVNEKKYEQYVEKCKKAGFNKDIKKDNSDFRAFNDQGFQISLDYYTYNKSLSIYIYEPVAVDGKEIKWPKNAFTKRIPQPDSLVGKIDTDSSEVFRVKLTGISKDDYIEVQFRCSQKLLQCANDMD